MNTTGKVSLLAVLANFVIMLLQVGIGLLAGSMAMVSDGIHTITDFMSSLIAAVTVKISARPADSSHPWGHGKFENLAALGQGILILASAGVIGWKAVQRLIEPQPLEIMEVGIAVTAASIVIQALVSWKVWRVGKETESPALIGVALHMLTDLGSSVSVLIGLAIVRFWGILIADAVAALVVTALIASGGIKLVVSSCRDLVDSSLPKVERDTIEGIFSVHMPPLKGFHKVRTRRVGRFRYLEAHLVVDGALSVEQAHDLCDHLEEHLQETIPYSRSVLHVEPDIFM